MGQGVALDGQEDRAQSLRWNYYVWTADGSERQILSHQRYFIIKRLLRWVNHG